MLKVTVQTDIPLTCTDCGATCLLTLPRWSDFGEMSVPLHECAATAVKAPELTAALGPTPRGADPAIKEFIAKHLTKGRGDDPLIAGNVAGAFFPPDAIDVSELHDLFEEEHAKGWGPGMFGRKLREGLPPGTDIRREMIHGQRARRLIGMRWK